MGFQQVMWSYGGSYGDPETFKVDGHINSEDVVKALEYYKSLKEFSPPDSPNYYWAETLDAYKAGKVAMAMDYFAFFPGVVSADQNPNYYDKTGFFVSPAGPKGHAISIGGQGMSISAYSKNQEIAKQYLKWFMQKPVQEKWAQLGGFTPHEEVLQSEVFLNATPFNKAFAAVFLTCATFGRFPNTRNSWRRVKRAGTKLSLDPNQRKRRWMRLHGNMKRFSRMQATTTDSTGGKLDLLLTHHLYRGGNAIRTFFSRVQ